MNALALPAGCVGGPTAAQRAAMAAGDMATGDASGMVRGIVTTGCTP